MCHSGTPSYPAKEAIVPFSAEMMALVNGEWERLRKRLKHHHVCRADAVRSLLIRGAKKPRTKTAAVAA